jgi:large subunit ribosomal protein L3
MIGMIAKKLGMTRVYDDDGRAIPVTVLECGPCPITQIKTPTSDGYTALQLAFGGDRKAKRTPRALASHLAKSGTGPMRVLREFRVDSVEGYQLGQSLDVSVFADVKHVKVSGITKGRGFTGVVKRHNWSGGPETHGSMSHAVVGSIGMHSDPGHVAKGHGMPGRYGGTRRSMRNLAVVKIDAENNLLFVEGAVPGFRNGIVQVEAARRG